MGIDITDGAWYNTGKLSKLNYVPTQVHIEYSQEREDIWT